MPTTAMAAEKVIRVSPLGQHRQARKTQPIPYRIRITSGLSDGTVFELADERTNIGRDDHNQIVLEDRTVSHFHAVVVRDDDTVKLRDLISTNGTFVNNQRIMNQVLRNGDTIRLGSVEARFESDIIAAPDPVPSERKTPSRRWQSSWLAWAIAIAGTVLLSLLITHHFRLWPFATTARLIERDGYYRTAVEAEARQDYRTLLYAAQILARRYPQASLPEFMLGIAYGQLGAFDDSAAAFRRTVELKPDDANAWYNLGVISQRRGYPGDAAAAFQKAARLRPTHADAWSGLVNAYVALQKPDKASEALLELRRVDPTRADHLSTQLRLPPT